MSHYTIQLRNYIDSFSFSLTNKPPELDMEKRIDAGIPHLFDFPMPWYDTSPAKEGLADFKKLFVLEYYMDEIGFETIALFKLNLRSHLTKVMPYYEQLFLSTKMEYDPLINHDFTSTYSDTSEQSNQSHDIQTGSTQMLVSDTPQITFAGQDFATGLNRGESGVQTTGNGSSEGTRSGSRTDKGFMGGSKSEEIRKWRENIVNLNMQLVDSCQDLFMLLGEMSEIGYNRIDRYIGHNPRIKGGFYGW